MGIDDVRVSSYDIEKPRAIVLANRLPFPIDDGWKTRTFHIIRGLVRHADVTLLCFHQGGSNVVDEFTRSLDGQVRVVTVPAPSEHTFRNLLLGLVTGKPVYVWNMRSGAYRDALRDLLRSDRPTIAIAELTYMYEYLREMPRKTLRVIDTHNIDSLVLTRYARTLSRRSRAIYAALTARKVRRLEAEVFSEVDRVWVCSETEIEAAVRIAPTARVESVPNGVDTGAFAPLPTITPAARQLLFFGRLDYEPNRDALQFFVGEILELIRRQEPGVEFVIAGAGDSRFATGLAARSTGVRVLGRVDDLPAVLAEATVIVVPLRMGGGTRLKILEALSMARPVVSTTLGAEGLLLGSGEHLLLADTSADFAEAVIRLLRNQALCQTLGNAGRAVVERMYSWDVVHTKLWRNLGSLQ
jgi:polysaccharide biosynthesis protein PslH